MGWTPSWRTPDRSTPPYIGRSPTTWTPGQLARLADADRFSTRLRGPPDPALLRWSPTSTMAVVDTGHSEPIIAVLVAADTADADHGSAPDARHAGDMLRRRPGREQLGLETAELLQRSLITIWRRSTTGADAEVIANLQERSATCLPGGHPAQFAHLRGQRQRLTVREHAEMFGPLAIDRCGRRRRLRGDHRPRPGACRCAGDPSGRVSSRRSTSKSPTSPGASAIRRSSARGLDDDELASAGASVDWSGTPSLRHPVPGGGGPSHHPPRSRVRCESSPTRASAVAS